MSGENRNRFPWIWVLVVLVALVGFIFYRDNAISNATNNIPTVTPTQSNEISWREAVDFIGDYKTVCGEIVQASVDKKTKGVFLNMGYKYPNENRFTIVFWPEAQISGREESDLINYVGQYICVTGTIKSYQGITEIEAGPSTPIKIGE
jgi:hypothetical protein